jgi:hypothetical protein
MCPHCNESRDLCWECGVCRRCHINEWCGWRDAESVFAEMCQADKDHPAGVTDVTCEGDK